MWTCPKCNREFKHKNQNHYCGDKPTTIDEYIAGFPPDLQELLTAVRTTISAAAPDAEERISWQMPTFWQKENLIHFAVSTNHLGIYPGDLSKSPFADRLSAYRTSKGAIQMPFDQPIDYDLIRDLTRWRVASANKPKAYGMKFAMVYPMYIDKAERKGRTKAEVDQVIFWLTGYDEAGLAKVIDRELDFEAFFAQAPQMNENAPLIKGVICGHRVEEIEDPVMQQIRWLDKLIDELAKGKAMEKIWRGTE
ncbi:uncharacterized protein YdhG (YjbR/CyaY superfamily) [Clostridiales Family XIII bacterium PM5-7]